MFSSSGDKERLQTKQFAGHNRYHTITIPVTFTVVQMLNQLATYLLFLVRWISLMLYGISPLNSVSQSLHWQAQGSILAGVQRR